LAPIGIRHFPDASGAKVMNPLWLGMLGMHGTFRANMAISNADVLFAVGARFDDRVTGKISGFAPKAKIIHIDVDPTTSAKMSWWTFPSWATAGRTQQDPGWHRPIHRRSGGKRREWLAGSPWGTPTDVQRRGHHQTPICGGKDL
jgi:thiamine pyrophosphate-dependent acetolactate synthase large subunit-like protein